MASGEQFDRTGVMALSAVSRPVEPDGPQREVSRLVEPMALEVGERVAAMLPLKRATRLERATFSLEGRSQSVLSAEQESTYDADDPHLVPSLVQLWETDADLATLIDAWPELPEPVKAGIIAMVKAATGLE